MSATSTDPAGARVTATWMARLSPGLHRTGYAGAATRAPDQTGFTRGCMRRAPDSPSVAVPSASAPDTTSPDATSPDATSPDTTSPVSPIVGSDLPERVAVGVCERLGELVHLQ